jgi:carbon storage regulator
MLVLSRKSGERLVVPGCGMTITVLETSSRRVRVGIEAPSDLGVYREEVWRRLTAPPVGTAAGPVSQDFPCPPLR